MPEKAKPSSEVQFISRVKAAELLDCSTQLIDKKIRLGQLPGYRFGRKVLIRKDQLLSLVEEI
jgi:excisionase family DNA binding protein